MPYHNVCRRGRPIGGKVRQDDVRLLPGESLAQHNAGGASPGILRLIREVVRGTPGINVPPKPAGFPSGVRVDTWPGRGHADVHHEGRAADVFLDYKNATQRSYGEWLFDYCVANCVRYGIQGVIYGPRQWFSEMHGGRVFARGRKDHYDHVHVELNCDGANMP